MDTISRIFNSQGDQLELIVDCEGASRDDLKAVAMNYWVWRAQNNYRIAKDSQQQEYKQGMKFKWNDTKVRHAPTDSEINSAIVTKIMAADTTVSKEDAEVKAEAIMSGITPDKPKVESQLRKKAA